MDNDSKKKLVLQIGMTRENKKSIDRYFYFLITYLYVIP